MTESSEILNLLKQYFNICNAALARNREKIAYGAALAIINRFASGKTITLQVIDDDPASSGLYTTKFVEGQFTPIQPGGQETDKRFTLHCHLLETVVAHPDDYIAHPEKLDWSWLGPG